MNKIKSFIYHKQLESFLSCDDNFSIDIAKKRFAISDGASSSFFSKVYSELLVDQYVKGEFNQFVKSDIDTVNLEWLNIAKSEVEAANNPITPYKLLVTRQPGCATFVGLNIQKKIWNVNAIGDSILFFISKGKTLPDIQISTYSKPDFSFYPDLNFSNSPLLTDSYNTSWCDKQTTYSHKLTEGTFLLVTDAMAKWILQSKSSDINKRFERVLNIKNQNEFEKFIIEIRESDAEMDDMTLMIIELNDISNLQFSEINIADYRKYREFNKVIERLKERFIGFKEEKEKALIELKSKLEEDFQFKVKQEKGKELEILNKDKEKALLEQKSELEREFQSKMSLEIEKLTKILKEQSDEELDKLKKDKEKALQDQKSELEREFQSKINLMNEELTKNLKQEKEAEKLKSDKSLQEQEDESEKKKSNIIGTDNKLTDNKKEKGEIIIETTTHEVLLANMGEIQKKTKQSKQNIMQIIIILLLFVVIGQLYFLILKDKNPISQTQKTHQITTTTKTQK